MREKVSWIRGLTCFRLAETGAGVDSPRVMNQEILAQTANEARGLAIDAVHTCSSGHLGLPLGCAEVGACFLEKV